MRFLMLYSNQFAVGNKPIGISSLGAMVKRAGHTFELFDCTKYNVQVDNKVDSNLVGQQNLRFKIPANPDRFPKRVDTTYPGLCEEFNKAIDKFKPDIIGLSALTDDYPLGLGLMRSAKRSYPNITTIAGGIHATVDPSGVLSEDCFDMICVGEGEHVIVDICERIEQGLGFEGILNLWVKKSDGKINRNPVRPYETNLDSFPFPDWSIFPEIAFYKPYLGWIYKYGDFEMSRGCPYKCSYCINVGLQEIYKGHQYHREKSIPRVIEEIKYAMAHYDIEFLKFWDETFLLMSEKRMEEFRDLYSGEIGIPYVIETTGQSITAFSVKILQDTNCRSASIGMETGSPDMRKGILHKPTNNSEYVDAYRLMGEHGIQKASFNMIGLPNESREDVFRTIGLNRLVGTDVQALGVFYPYKGTPIRDMMVQKGWMNEDHELDSLTNYDFNTFTAGNLSVVHFKDMDALTLQNLWKHFQMYVLWPVILYPLIDHSRNNDGEFPDSLFSNLRRISYLKKFGDLPPLDNEADESPAEDAKKAASACADLFEDPEAQEFASLLVEHWTGIGFDKMAGILRDIASGDLKPEYTIPSSEEKLIEWLEIDLSAESDLHVTRTEMREIAKANAAQYTIDLTVA